MIVRSEMELVARTNLTCPVCGSVEAVDIPSDY